MRLSEYPSRMRGRNGDVDGRRGRCGDETGDELSVEVAASRHERICSFPVVTQADREGTESIRVLVTEQRLLVLLCGEFGHG